jgi:hypothetical protein
MIISIIIYIFIYDINSLNHRNIIYDRIYSYKNLIYDTIFLVIQISYIILVFEVRVENSVFYKLIEIVNFISIYIDPLTYWNSSMSQN